MKKNRRNYYRILHVQHDAPDAVIRASYRTIMHKLKQHPDLGGDHWNATVINEAYAVLSDPDKRSAYDATLFSERQQENVSTPDRSAAADRRSTTAGTNTEMDDDGEQGRLCCPFCRLDNHPSRDNCHGCQAPLTPPPAIPHPIDRQRHIERLTVRDKAVFFDHWPQTPPCQAVMLDISPLGCQLWVSHPVADQRIIKIETARLAATGIVHRCQPQSLSGEPGHLLSVGFKTLRFHKPEGGFVSARA